MDYQFKNIYYLINLYMYFTWLFVFLLGGVLYINHIHTHSHTIFTAIFYFSPTFVFPFLSVVYLSGDHHSTIAAQNPSPKNPRNSRSNKTHRFPWISILFNLNLNTPPTDHPHSFYYRLIFPFNLFCHPHLRRPIDSSLQNRSFLCCSNLIRQWFHLVDFQYEVEAKESRWSGWDPQLCYLID